MTWIREGLRKIISPLGQPWTHRVILSVAIVISAAACLPSALWQMEDTSRNLKSLSFIFWQDAILGSSPASSAHLGEVLAVREVTGSQPHAVSAGADGNVILWDLTTGSGRLLTQVGGPMQVAALGRRHALVAWSSGLSVLVACVSGCSERWELSRLRTRTTSIDFHEDDRAIIIGGVDGRVYRWHFQREHTALTQDERDRSLERYIAHQTMVSAVTPLHTGRAFFSADWQGRLYAWLAYTADDHQGSYDRNLFGGRFFGGLGTYMYAGRLADRGITALSVSENGHRLAVGTDDGYVEVWDVRGFEIAARTLTHVGRVISVALSNDGSRVASLGRDGAIIAADIISDPSYGINATALRATAAQVFKEEMKSARGIYFLSTGDLLLSTNTGHIGEIQLSSTPQIAPAPLLRVTPGVTTTEKGSDY